MSKILSPHGLRALLAERRKSEGLTCADLGRRLEVTRQSAWRIENEAPTRANRNLTIRALRELGCEVEGPLYRVSEPETERSE